ncbi:MAG: NAD(P)-binding domain-containing protein [Moorea sp. SIO4A3]|nr:NAD(P)-binding domain-containing protein [Moorena sp. SIO4A3]
MIQVNSNTPIINNLQLDSNVGEELFDQYDTFGIYRAVQLATRRTPWWNLFVAKLIDWTIFRVALLPLPLALVSSVFLVISGGSVLLKWMVGVFWLWIGLFIIDQFRLLSLNKKLSIEPALKCSEQRRSVIVIGAGPIGIAVVKECIEQGLEVQCFEQKDNIGGVFRPNREFPGGCWPTVRLTSSPWITAYSDFPPKSSSSEHYTLQEYLEYLANYVEHFRFWNHLHFRQTVTDVKPNEKGGWIVTTVDRVSGETVPHHCDRVAICTGVNLIPKPIQLPGLDSFTGEVRHSAMYKGVEGLRGKHVVIVGAGESGVDIAAEVSYVAENTYLSIRKGKFIIPRINPLTGMANDYDTNRIRNAPPIILQNWLMTLKRRLCFHTGDHTPESAFRTQLLKNSDVGPMSQAVTKSDDFIYRVIEGKLNLRRDLVGFDGDEVIFSDGIRHRADVVIFAHGYFPSFPFLKYPKDVQALHPGNMYLNMFHPEIGYSLAFCGFARPKIGAIPPTGELQARLFALVAAGKRLLPDARFMERDIIQTRKENALSFPTQPPPNVLINWISYMDKVANLIGSRPNPLYLLKKPRLLWKFCSGPVTGAHYRLTGPGASQTSLETIMKLPRMHQINEIITYIGLHFWLWPLQIINPNSKWHKSNTIW